MPGIAHSVCDTEALLQLQLWYVALYMCYMTLPSLELQYKS